MYLMLNMFTVIRTVLKTVFHSPVLSAPSLLHTE